MVSEPPGASSLKDLVGFVRHGLVLEYASPADQASRARIVVQADGDVLCTGTSRYFERADDQAAHRRDLAARLAALSTRASAALGQLTTISSRLRLASSVIAVASLVLPVVDAQATSWGQVACELLPRLLGRYSGFLVSLVLELARWLFQRWIRWYVSSLIAGDAASTGGPA